MDSYQIYCPSCGCNINADINNREYVFCTYCGQKVYFQKENVKKVQVEYHKRVTNEAEIIKEKKEIEKMKYIGNGIKWVLKMVFLFAFIIFCTALYFSIIEPEIEDYRTNQKIAKAISEGKICAGSYWHLTNEDYRTVEAHLISAGFINIELIELNDLDVSSSYKGKVETVSIAGNNRFGSDDYFDPDSKVVISYH